MEKMLVRGTNAVLLLILLSSWTFLAHGYEEDERKTEEEEWEGGKSSMFLLRNAKEIVKTEAGEVRVLRGYKRIETSTPMHVGFIRMEPSSLFIPQYIDASLVMFVRRGEMKIGWIYKDHMVEKRLRSGDVYRIPSGSTFYVVNVGEGQTLQLICSIDTTESLGGGVFQSFYIGGGRYPTSVLAGFDVRTLTTAFNVSTEELSMIMRKQKEGPIVYIKSSEQLQKWQKLMQLKQNGRIGARMIWEEEDNKEENESEWPTKWTWRKLLETIMGIDNKDRTSVSYPDAYNVYNKSPDFRNSYGWSLAIDEHDYPPLKHSGIGVYYVNLTAGSMMAPHVNPRATEYGVILRGSGSIQVVFPNGSLAMNADVSEGDVFWVPRYFPFCQIAARAGPMEFFGFTTSARRNRPQFLVGRRSVLQSMTGPEMAMAFDLSEERLRKLINAQEESVILPPWPRAGDRTIGSKFLGPDLVSFE